MNNRCGGASLSLLLHIHYGGSGVRFVEFHPSSQGFHWIFFKETLDSHLENLIHEWLQAYLDKKKAPYLLPLDWSALPLFTKEVLKRVESIPFGETLSYGQIAHLLGRPQAARAVGGACGRNPFLLFVPCHRVLDAQFSLRGFSAGGVLVKKALLEFEDAF